jgi:hypothetical protein
MKICTDGYVIAELDLARSEDYARPISLNAFAAVSQNQLQIKVPASVATGAEHTVYAAERKVRKRPERARLPSIPGSATGRL